MFDYVNCLNKKMRFPIMHQHLHITRKSRETWKLRHSWSSVWKIQKEFFVIAVILLYLWWLRCCKKCKSKDAGLNTSDKHDLNLFLSWFPNSFCTRFIKWTLIYFLVYICTDKHFDTQRIANYIIRNIYRCA